MYPRPRSSQLPNRSLFSIMETNVVIARAMPMHAGWRGVYESVFRSSRQVGLHQRSGGSLRLNRGLLHAVSLSSSHFNISGQRSTSPSYS
jgi:hypothetical protein